MVDLHRHDEFSLYDGYGKCIQLAAIAKELGHTSLSQTNHGTTSGLAEHYFACKDKGIKPILGVEAYFQPQFNKDKERYHLCLFAMNLKGYQNMNRLMTEGWLNQRYYVPIIDFALLEKYKEGLICSSACVQGFISAMIRKGNKKLAVRALERFKEIFGDNFYIEIQPYKIEEEGLQELVNERLMQLAEEYDVKCVLTSDSHFGRKEDFSSYLKMHEMKGRDLDKIAKTYRERYMPTDKELYQRFRKMHSNYSKDFVFQMLHNLEEIEAKCEDNILDQLPLKLPNAFGEESTKLFRKEIVKGLKAKGKYNDKYLNRCKEEAKVIEHLGYVDYFLIVQDYVKWAKSKDIEVGPGRGSVCNCLIAYALDITNIDSIYFDLDFNRFMRMDKKKVPDIDLDFETDRRDEVIDYLLEKYKDKSAKVISYGLYKVDNLLNDLFKVCGVTEKSEQAALKKFVAAHIEEEVFDYEEVKKMAECKMWNKQYDDILEHFSKTYKKIRFYGTHASGIAIAGDDLLNYTAMEVHGDKIVTAYDLGNLELIHVVKFDLLGLRTMSISKELKNLTGKSFDYSWCEDKNLLDEFGKGNTDGIFQFESAGAQDVLRTIDADCIEDVLAGAALNRPGPLSIGMPAQYGANKENIGESKETVWFKYAPETYGTIIYQEQIIRVCRDVGKYSWPEVDRILKVLKGRGRAIKFIDREIDELLSIFRKGAMENGYTQDEADEMFKILRIYSFNKGHAAGYAVIGIMMMYYKVYYPQYFWYIILKYANDKDIYRFESKAVSQGTVILLPHVNYKARYSMVKIDGEATLAEGLTNIKNVGEKAAAYIEAERKENGRFTDLDDFLERCKGRSVTTRVISALKEAGALEFNKKTYFSRVKKYNSTLYMKGCRD